MTLITPSLDLMLITFISVIICMTAFIGGKDYLKNHLNTHMLVLAVEVSHSPANPTMSNPVDSWLKNLG